MIFWCKNCLYASTRPRISFDKRGFCNACQWVEEKKKINWKNRQERLRKIFNKNKKTKIKSMIALFLSVEAKMDRMFHIS